MLAVIHGATFGGPCNEIATLALALRPTTFVVLIPDEVGRADERLTAAGVVVVRQPMVRLRRLQAPTFWLAFPWRFLRDVLRIRKLATSRRADVIHGYGINLQAAAAARLAGIPLVWSLIDSGAPGIARKLATRVLRSAATSVLLDGDSMAARYPGISGGKSRTSVYYPPVDLDLFSPSDVKPPSQPIVVGTVANLNPDKDLDCLLDAASVVIASSDARFEVTGGRHGTHDALADHLHARAAELEDDRFRFLGETDDVPSRLRSMDIFVVSSLREGTTTTAIEAMAVGLPVVATSVGGVPEVVDDGVTGILVPPRDPEAMAAAILRLLGDAELRSAMGRRGRQRALELFGAQRFIGEVDAAYASAVRSATATTP